ncbi:hypothetical protein [Mycobacterium sp.]|jgi:hypothetical protein|uniref:hypothetical protein n=1 Tax=Mycobacterium sp. TaxID=1785 RepID=UPI003F9A7A50
MTSAQGPLTEAVSDTLYKVMPRYSELIEHYREQAIWDLAIIEALAIIAKSDEPELPARIAQGVRELYGRKDVSPRFHRAAERYLARIRTY